MTERPLHGNGIQTFDNLNDDSELLDEKSQALSLRCDINSNKMSLGQAWR